MSNDITKLSKKAAMMISSIPKSTRIRIISHYDADGISAASIICKSLNREGYDFHATLMRNPFTKGLESVRQEKNELIIFSDMGSGQIELIEKLDCKAIIIDHHQFRKEETSKNIIQINANVCGINGNYEACGASMSYSVAKALNSRNADLAPLAIIGLTGDKQYIGGITGFNRNILDEALEKGFLKQEIGLKLNGDTLFDAMYYSIDPYYTKLSGNQEGIYELLERLKVNKKTKIEDLDNNKIKKLQSYMIFNLIKNGVEKNILDTVIRERYISNIFNCEVERFADLLDACGKGGNRGLGLAICFNDRKAFDEAVEIEKEYKQKILKILLELEKNGIKNKRSFRYFYSNESSLGGVIGGIASNFIFNKEKPLISIVRKDDEIHISCRGNQYLVGKGLDLGFAMKDAAIKLNGNGGGHKIAAGATVNSDKENEFLDIIDKIIYNQIMV